MMINKCYLYIDGFPRNASDVPYDISIDWGDGSVPEEYSRLTAGTVPQLYHIYNDAQPRDIEVTITNSCGSITQTIIYVPFLPIDCECRNFHSVSLNDVQVSFSGVSFDIKVSSCFTDILENEDGISATLITDVSTNLPLITFPKKYEEFADKTFELVTPEINQYNAVKRLLAHTREPIPEDFEIVPAMNGDTEPKPYVASASSVHLGSAWCVFALGADTGTGGGTGGTPGTPGNGSGSGSGGDSGGSGSGSGSG